MTPDARSNLEKAKRYLKALEGGDGTFLTELFAADATAEQLPNRIFPHGIRSNLTEMAEAFEKGRQLFSGQTYAIQNEAVNGNLVALEVLWTGKLALPFASLEAGSEIQAHSAMFMEFRNGKIIAQRNYDCFEPW